MRYYFGLYLYCSRLRDGRKKVECRIKKGGGYMKKCRWKNEEKFRIVLEGLLGQASVAEICNKYGIR